MRNLIAGHFFYLINSIGFHTIWGKMLCLTSNYSTAVNVRRMTKILRSNRKSKYQSITLTIFLT